MSSTNHQGMRVFRFYFTIFFALFAELEKSNHFILGKAVVSDWKNWHKIDENHKKNTYLADPVTTYLAIHPEEINRLTPKKVSFPCLNAMVN